MKKTLSAAFALIISAALLSACGSVAEENSAATVNTAEAAAYSEPELTEAAASVSEDDALIPAEQEDILGAWIKRSAGVIFLFEDSCIDVMLSGQISRSYAEVSGGKVVSSGETQLPECSFYLSGDKLLYVSDSERLTLERYKETELTAEMLDGCRTEVVKTVTYDTAQNTAFSNKADGRYFCFDGSTFCEPWEGSSGSYTITGQTITLPIDGKNAAYTYYICGDYLYFLGDEDYLVFYGAENKLRLME